MKRIIGLTQFEIDEYIYKKYEDFITLSFTNPIKNITPLLVVENNIYHYLMQTLGIECGVRLTNEDIWVNALQYEINKYDDKNFIINNIRFNNEAEFVKNNGGIIIHVITDVDIHSSGIEIDINYIDYIISISYLFKLIDQILIL